MRIIKTMNGVGTLKFQGASLGEVDYHIEVIENNFVTGGYGYVRGDCILDVVSSHQAVMLALPEGEVEVHIVSATEDTAHVETNGAIPTVQAA